MKRTLAVLVMSAAILAGCSKSHPTPVPSVSVSPSVEISEAPTTASSTAAPTTSPTPEDTATTSNTDPGGGGATGGKTEDPTPTASDPGTPADQFASRWGKRYPAVQEYEILKAANNVCTEINNDAKWQSSEGTVKAVENYVDAAGMKPSDGLEFGQDAFQTYCSVAP